MPMPPTSYTTITLLKYCLIHTVHEGSWICIAVKLWICVFIPDGYNQSVLLLCKGKTPYYHKLCLTCSPQQVLIMKRSITHLMVLSPIGNNTPRPSPHYTHYSFDNVMTYSQFEIASTRCLCVSLCCMQVYMLCYFNVQICMPELVIQIQNTIPNTTVCLGSLIGTLNKFAKWTMT